MSEDLYTRLQRASTRNLELLATIAQTDHATTALPQAIAYISDLETQLKQTDYELKKLHATTEDERKDHLKYRDSTFKRYAHKMRGQKGQEKFTSKQEKEEREFMEAWQKEREAETCRAEIDHALQTARNDRENFKQTKKQHDAAQAELDQMYSQIFSGPTPEVPGEDQMENVVQQSKQWLEQCQASFDTEKSAGECLRRAEQRLTAADKNMKEALGMSRMDLMGGGSFVDMMERDAMSKASVSFSEVLFHMNAARTFQPAIQQLDNVTIDMGHVMSDMFFDNIFTDMAQHDRIKASDLQLQTASAQLQEQINLQLARASGARDQLNQARQDTESARAELQRIRAETFETYGRNVGSGFGAPPPYHSFGQV